MISIDRHIEILLLNNDCVIVPGLGGFIAHHVSARYDEETSTFLPPLRTLGFNPQLQINDSLLAQSYIEAFDISYPEAVRRIEDEVNEICQELRNKGCFEMNDIGTLKLNEYGKTEFFPCEAGILTPSLYGLNTVDINALTKSEDIHIAPIAHPAVEEKVTSNIEDSINDSEIEEDSGEHAITISMSTVRYALTTAAVVLALFLFSLPLNNDLNKPAIEISGIDTGLTKLMPKETVIPPSTVVTEVATIKDSINNNIATTTEDKQTKPKEGSISNNTEKGSYYTIVMASRVTTTNANEYVSKLKKDGLKAKTIERANGAKVICGNFKNEDEARDFLRSKRMSDNRFDEAWILEVRI